MFYQATERPSVRPTEGREEQNKRVRKSITQRDSLLVLYMLIIKLCFIKVYNASCDDNMVRTLKIKDN